MRLGLCCLFLGLAVGAGPALAQDSGAGETKPKATAARPKATKPAAAKPAAKPALKLASTSSAPVDDPLAEVPTSERAAIRAALLWSAGEDAATRTEGQVAAAIAAFRKRNGSKASGALTAPERDALLAAARNHEQEFGWKVVTDPATGIRLGLPTKLVPQAREADQGTRWSSRHGDVQVETFRFKTSEAVSALFERMKKEPATRKTEYSVMRPDNFFISGLQGLRKFSVRAFVKDGEVRGFVTLFDQAVEGIVAPVMVAMASAFAPFPERVAPFAALSRPVEYGTGTIVAANGYIVTDSRLTDGCQVIVANGIGNADRIAVDKDHGLALLRVFGRRNLLPAPLAAAAPHAGDLTLAGIADPHIQDGNRNLSELKARLGSGNTLELRQPVPVAGFSGAAAIDGEGRVLGMMETRNAVLASSEPAVPPVRLVPAETIREFLAAHNIAPTAEGDARTAIVRIICVRK